MTEVATTVGERGVPLARLSLALMIALAGLAISVTGFLVDNAAMIAVGVIVSGSASIAVNRLATAMNP
jgi:NAD/NADP transhydrogenase beta subunit